MARPPTPPSATLTVAPPAAAVPTFSRVTTPTSRAYQRAGRAQQAGGVLRPLFDHLANLDAALDPLISLIGSEQRPCLCLLADKKGLAGGHGDLTLCLVVNEKTHGQ
jgi:hypothetical protein